MTDTQFCFNRYGDPAAKAFQSKLYDYVFPAWLAPHWPDYAGRPVTHQWLNKDIIASLEEVFRELIATGLVDELKTYGGAGMLRYKRGLKPIPANLSIHSWYCALDFNQLLNGLGVKMGSKPGMFTPAFLAVWRKHGWTCGADFSRPDGMHFQYIPGYGKAPARSVEDVTALLKLAQVKDASLRAFLLPMGEIYGAKKAAMRLQAAANLLGGRLTVDGLVGPATLAAVNGVKASDIIKKF